ncbi:probable inorganic polyphosphate/ATP-NAD kinase [Clostridium sp. CAG:590]|nr:probable inorganic polyphosphate/ATP-NAD kinase [Clostridium sp. CAG:590]
MKRFLIATNFIKDENLSLTSKVERYLEEHGASSTRINGQQGDYSAWIPQEEHAGSYDCVIALGGDGTILKVSRDLRHLNIPIVGVNLGTLGFLAEIEPEQIYPVLDRLLADDYELEERMNICGSVFKCGAKEPLLKDVALNDIVVSRAGFSRVIGLRVYVNGRVMDIYEADGVIVSTPTGSTGYNLSAGGPIVSPKTHVMIITPISPHSLTSKSIVLGDADEIVLEVLKMRKAQEEEAIVNFDGQPGTQLSAGDKVVIRKAGQTTKMVKLFDVSFYEVLREKMANHL